MQIILEKYEYKNILLLLYWLSQKQMDESEREFFNSVLSDLLPMRSLEEFYKYFADEE